MVGRKLDRDTVVAAIVRLLDLGHIRIGNESYATENKSFGATTLRDRHAQVKGGTVKMRFQGKSGNVQALYITDRSITRHVTRSPVLPAQPTPQFDTEKDQNARSRPA